MGGGWDCYYGGNEHISLLRFVSWQNFPKVDLNNLMTGQADQLL